MLKFLIVVFKILLIIGAIVGVIDLDTLEFIYI